MQKQQRIVLPVGIILCFVVVFLIKIYLDEQQKQAQNRAREAYERELASQKSILVAKDDIPIGTILDPRYVEAKIIPKRYVAPRAMTSTDEITGMVVVAFIPAGEQITSTKLSSKPQMGRLASLTPVGKRAITVSVDNIATLAGMIKAGDRVDVLALLPMRVRAAEEGAEPEQVLTPLFQNVEVLAVGQDTSEREKEDFRFRKDIPRDSSSPYITLALTPYEANLLTFVQEQGKIRLSLRSPADTSIAATQPANWDTLLEYLYPSAPKVEYGPDDYVEIYRGLEKEKVLLSK